MILILICALFCSKEGFGMSPGVMDQLASSHVPTESDLTEEKIEREQVRKDLYDMTESDL
jgi:hypothetical protein